MNITDFQNEQGQITSPLFFLREASKLFIDWVNEQDASSFFELAHSIAKQKGFYDEPTCRERIGALIVSELYELYGAYRNDNKSIDDIAAAIHELSDTLYMYEKGYHKDGAYKLYAQKFKDSIKGTKIEEMADVFLRVADAKGYEDATFEFNGGEIRPSDLMTEIEYQEEFAIDNFAFTGQHTKLLQGVFQKYYNSDIHLLAAVVAHKMMYNTLRPYKHGKDF